MNWVRVMKGVKPATREFKARTENKKEQTKQVGSAFVFYFGDKQAGVCHP